MQNVRMLNQGGDLGFFGKGAMGLYAGAVAQHERLERAAPGHHASAEQVALAGCQSQGNGRAPEGG